MIVLQIGISCIPGDVQDSWMIDINTMERSSTLLFPYVGRRCYVLATWNPRKSRWSAYGSSHVNVIKNEGCGCKLEDLVAGRIVPSRLTAVAICVLTVLRILHFMVVQSIEDGGWYLLAVGGIGMLQNVVSAGARRKPGALGFHLEIWKIDEKTGNILTKNKVSATLMAAEDIENRVGLVLVDVFLPGGLRPDEEQWHKEKLEQYEKEGTERTGTHTGGRLPV